MIWLGISILYVCMFSPIIFALISISRNPYIAYTGAGIMGLGLLLETIGDYQKSTFKKENPKLFCNTGLYKWVRCPNYFGEILIWTGNLIVGISFFVGWWQWLIALFGWICIVLIMMGSTKRLEKKQLERYGEDPEFQKYITSVPVLFPWLPIYSLAKVKVYLE